MRAIEEGGATTLTVELAEVDNPSLQWFHDGESIPGATGPSLRLEEVGRDQAGGYQLQMSYLQSGIPVFESSKVAAVMIESGDAVQGMLFNEVYEGIEGNRLQALHSSSRFPGRPSRASPLGQ
ncbi:MAG: hypothetical protein GWO24_05820, partial [Akkermansiaceae bacterium]|nr:hypothetical protein [Akkermansiaceae bacterium]